MEDLTVMLFSLVFKLTTAIIAYLIALTIEAHLHKRKGLFHAHLVDADPEAKAIYLGLRRLSIAVLVGLCVG